MAKVKYIRYRDESSSTGLLFLAAGALAGLAAGVFLAQRFGGFGGIASRVRGRLGRETEALAERGTGDEYEEEDEIEEDEDLDPAAAELEERVLEAFRNDPILSQRAIDIGAVGAGTIELTGWVHTGDESDNARTVAGGVPGVATVVNRLSVRAEEDEYEANARSVAEGDPALTEARWEGIGVGTGRRRQGTSAEFDRHADPKPELEDRWLSKEEALREAAEDTGDVGARRRTRRPTRGDRTGGAPIAPTGVPKGDHVAAPPDGASEPPRAD